MPCTDKDHQKRLQREWYQRNRERILDERKARKVALRTAVHQYKLDRGCNRCGYNLSAYAIDAHHVDGKDFTISDAIRRLRPLEAIMTELRRCELVCANWHRIEHHGDH